MDSSSFEMTLEAGEALADAYRSHTEATHKLNEAQRYLQAAKTAVGEAELWERETKKKYDDTKVALIASVEAL